MHVPNMTTIDARCTGAQFANLPEGLLACSHAEAGPFDKARWADMELAPKNSAQGS